MTMPDRIPEMVLYKAKWDPKQQMFIWRAYKAAQSTERRWGVPASVTLAQGIIESASGYCHGGDANNYFGIKAKIVKGQPHVGSIATGAKRLMTQEEYIGVKVNVPDYFRTYKDMADSIEDHGKWIRNNSRYQNAVMNYIKTGDADQFAKDLALNKYATASNYAVSIIAIMRRYDLYRYNIRQLSPVPR